MLIIIVKNSVQNEKIFKFLTKNKNAKALIKSERKNAGVKSSKKR